MVYKQKTQILADRDMVLQIVHINSSHWALVTTMGCSEGTIHVYDSLNATISSETINIIDYLFHFDTPEFTVKVRQVGTQDRALFAIEFTVTLAHGDDPTTTKYNQELMRPHLITCFEKNEISPFPAILKKRKILKREQKSETFKVYCYCRLPDNGDEMICCDRCDRWYHLSCTNSSVINTADHWYCLKCCIEQ